MIYFVSFRKGSIPKLLRVSADGGYPEIITIGGKNMCNVTMAPNGHLLAFVDNINSLSIWRVTPMGKLRKVSFRQTDIMMVLCFPGIEYGYCLAPTDGESLTFGQRIPTAVISSKLPIQ